MDRYLALLRGVGLKPGDKLTNCRGSAVDVSSSEEVASPERPSKSNNVRSKPPMSKPTLSPKMIYNSRTARNKLLNKPPSYQSDLCMKEIKPALDKKIKIMGSKPLTCKSRDRNLEDFTPKTENPYSLPQLMKTFFRKKIEKPKIGKTKPVMSEPRTICDLDDAFYKVIEGRPLGQFSDIKVYMKNLRNITLFRTNAAFVKERIMQINLKYTYELNQYNNISESFYKSKDNFAHFVEESYNEAKRIQDKAEMKSMKLAFAMDKLEHYSFKYVKLRNQIGHITFLFNNLAMYRRFIFSISPISWRKQHDSQFTVDYRSIDTFTDLNDNSEDVFTNMDSIQKFRIKLSSHEKATLYFKTPDELILVFDELRKQCLTYVVIDNVTSKLVKSVIKSRDRFKANLVKAVQNLNEWIISFEEEILYLEEREMTYKEAFNKLLMSEFQKLYSSHETIKLFTCVQYVYFNIIGGHEEPNDSVVKMMRDVENQYYDINLNLDYLNNEIVKDAKKELFAQDIKIIKRAHNAQRALTEYERLRKALYESFEPPRNKVKNKITPKKKQIEN